MRKRNMSRALAVALSIAMASGNVVPASAAQPETQLEQDALQEDEVVSESESTQAEDAGVENEADDVEAEETSSETVQDDSEALAFEEEVVEADTISSTTILVYQPENANYTLKYQFREVNGKKEAVIRGYGDNYIERNIVIPSTVSAPDTYSNCADYQNIPVTAIDQNAFADNCPTSVVIPASVESIGINAFAGGSKQKVYTLQSVVIEEGSKLKEIGKWAFQNQAGLAGELTIPKDVTLIGEGAFYNCEKLTGITFKGAGVIEDKAFSGCINAAGDLALPANVSTIGKEAFANYGKNVGSAELSLPIGLVSIGEKAFYNTNRTGDLVIPSTVETIGANAFQSAYIKKDGDELTNKLIFETGSKLTTIDKYAFSQCISFCGDIALPANLTTLGDYAFQKCTGFNGTVTLPAKLETIGMYAFSECTCLIGDVKIPDSVTKMGNYAFNKCQKLNGTVTLSKNLKIVPPYAFSECSSLTGSIVIPDGVETVDTKAFYMCSSMDGTLTLPESVKTIGTYAFSGCELLKGAIKIPEAVTAIKQDAFSGCASFTSLSMPDTIKTIEKNAFMGCLSLKSELKLPTSLTSIGEAAFAGCSNMTGNLDIPTGVTTVGKDAFREMTGLKGYLYLPDTLTKFGENCFYGCSNLTNKKDENGQEMRVVIAEGTTTLPQWMFYGCENLTSIQVPQTIKTISSAAFARTNNGLILYVYAGGDGAKWARSLSAGEKTFDIKYLDALVAITLSNKNQTIRVGNTRDLTATLRYYKEQNGEDVPVDVAEKDAEHKLTWTMSSKGAYANYADGKITAVKSGSEKITATAPDGKTYDSCSVTVVDRYVRSIKLDDTTAVTMKSNDKMASAVVNATISLQGFAEAIENNEIKESDLSVSFKQSTDGVLSIAPGNLTFNDDYTEATISAVVTPAKGGTSSVTVVASATGDAKETVSSARSFKIVAPLQSVKIPATAQVKEGKTTTLSVIYGPEDATNKKVEWTSSDTAIAKVSSSGVVTGVKEGTVTITCTPVNVEANGDSAKPVTCKVTVLSKTALEAVQNVKAAPAGKNKVTLTWSKTDYADGYIIYAKKNGKYGYCGIVNSGSTLTYTDTKAPDSDFGFYWVYAYKNKSGGTKEVGPVGKYVYSKGICNAVTNLKASSLVGGVKLTWTKSADAQGYLIYGMNKENRKYHYIGMTSTTSYTDKKADTANYNFYWVIPYHKDASGKIVAGQIVSKYTYGRAR